MNEIVSTTTSAEADSLVIEAHPRFLFGKRAQAGVPHTGWECVSVDDVEDDLQMCEMCESQEIRYVFHMQHPHYPNILEVGCDCAEMMGLESKEAQRRLRQTRNRARRRANWVNKGWKVSANGNEWRRTPYYRFIILRRMQAWTFKVVRRADDYEYDAPERFSSADEAKLATFDFLCLVSRVM